MNLNEDVIQQIKEYAGITTLDIVNAYYKHKEFLKANDSSYYNEVNIKKIRELVQLIPYLYKSCKVSTSATHEKHYLEFFLDGYCSRTTSLVALSLFFPIQNGKVYAKRVSDIQLARLCKKSFNLYEKSYRIGYDNIHKLMRQLIIHKKKGCDTCGTIKHKISVTNTYPITFLCMKCMYQRFH